jgi:hypothetical protein
MTLMVTRWWLALTNLGRRKPRGSGINLWGKFSDGRDCGFSWRGAGRITDPFCEWVQAHGQRVYRHSKVCRPYRSADRRALQMASWPELRGDPGFHQCNDRAFRHAACSLGGAREQGFWPRRKISMMRMGPPQPGHGSRRVSGTASVSCTASCSGRGALSRARIFAILALRVALASNP